MDIERNLNDVWKKVTLNIEKNKKCKNRESNPGPNDGNVGFYH